MQLSNFLSPLIEKIVFFPLYILAFFADNQLTLDMWVYFWALYSVPTFLRKINYAFDFQKKDIENYYREKRKELENQAIEAVDTVLPPEDEDN